ncbi:hypothetical protein ACGFZB_27180 [Streptomyces cinerochromogenes]|uniref:Twin-arginine translocation signal domain-containing protein n=1 Tax=Streptomyces cinerochromogenes TaxID=66422 RepID=A0ABW7BA13_9ACTN
MDAPSENRSPVARRTVLGTALGGAAVAALPGLDPLTREGFHGGSGQVYAVPRTGPRGRCPWGPGGGWWRRSGTAPDGLVQDRQVVRGGDALGVDVVAGGGRAGIACRRHPGTTTGHR